MDIITPCWVIKAEILSQKMFYKETDIQGNILKKYSNLITQSQNVQIQEKLYKIHKLKILMIFPTFIKKEEKITNYNVLDYELKSWHQNEINERNSKQNYGNKLLKWTLSRTHENKFLFNKKSKQYIKYKMINT